MTEPDILTRRLAELPVLLADGATGTNLFAMGLQTGDSPELWNVDHPDRIVTLYRNFIYAGSDLILTNSFGGTRFRLGLHGADNRVHELNSRAASIAREQVAAADRPVIVAGSMGPTGEILEPNGTVSVSEAAAAFAENGSLPEPTPGLEFYDTGVELITDRPADGIPATSSDDGLKKCWG